MVAERAAMFLPRWAGRSPPKQSPPSVIAR